MSSRITCCYSVAWRATASMGLSGCRCDFYSENIHLGKVRIDMSTKQLVTSVRIAEDHRWSTRKGLSATTVVPATQSERDE